MNIFLGVRSKVSNLELGDESHWCVYSTSDANIGDYLFMYQKGQGVVQLFKIISQPSSVGEFDCEYRNLLTVKTKLVLNLENKISYQNLKKDEKFKNSYAVKRNFQAAIFNLKEDESLALIELVRKENPNLILPF